MNKRWIKDIRALQLKKNRKNTQQFIVEGRKNILELLDSNLQVEALFYTEKYARPFETHNRFAGIPHKGITTEKELLQAGTLQSNDCGIAIAKMPEQIPLSPEANEIVLALDDVRDPGNLGTILRIADWYGITKVVCSSTTADVYNPKVIAASMGAFARIQTHYCSLPDYLEKIPDSIPIMGAFMDGENLHTLSIPPAAIIVMGNESNGISELTAQQITRRITIPRFGGAESLNVAIATAIICDNFKRG